VANSTIRQERPLWCPHSDCLFKRRAVDHLCVGKLPHPEPHDGDFNTHRLCINAEPIFDLQINNADAGWFRYVLAEVTP